MMYLIVFQIFVNLKVIVNYLKQLNIQKNLDEYKDIGVNLIQGNLNYKTINRFINESSNDIHVNIRNLLSKYEIQIIEIGQKQ